MNQNWGIGRDGGLLVHIPGDMRFFREKTKGSVVVMGRRTLESFPGGRPLKDRVNVVLTKDPSVLRPEVREAVTAVSGTEELFRALSDYPGREVFVIGGAAVYRELLPYCDECLVTVNDCPREADTFFPDLDKDPSWELSDQSEEHTEDGVRYRFRTYVRKAGGALPPEENGDYLVRATAADGSIRAFAATTRNTVETARQKHNTSPVVTAALGRLLTAGLIMGCDMKGENDVLTLKIDCQGPVKGLTVTADSRGHVKGYANVPDVMLPPNQFRKLDVGGALDLGVLSVIKDVGLKEPYVGQTILVSGEIAEDLTYYFATSEQTPSSVALGVLMNRDNTVRQAGGFLIQLLPGAGEDVVSALEKKISGIRSMTAMLDDGMTPEDVLREVLSGFKPVFLGRQELSFRCDCSKARVRKALYSIGAKDLNEMIGEGQPAELVCHFCNTKYRFSIEELKEIAEQQKNGKEKSL